MSRVLSLFIAAFLASGMAAAESVEIFEKIVGVGMVLEKSPETGVVTVGALVKGAPADKSGLIRPGMLVDSVYSNDLAQWVKAQEVTLEAIVGLIRGPAGTEVDLQMMEPEADELIQVRLIREEFEVGD